MKVPKHIGIIPDGNRRWAQNKGLLKEQGYDKGLDPGLELYRLCKEKGVEEITYYGFTMDNTKRPANQTKAFIEACINAVNMLTAEDAALLVLGNTDSAMFPKELLPYTTRKQFGKGTIKVNFLVNYGWHWDLGHLIESKESLKSNYYGGLKSSDISRIDLVIRWGGRRRLSGLLPAQAVYADFYVIDEYWPDFKPQHFYDALDWYQHQDITLGG
ncbi:undecaprenyl diphosphate synthase [Alkaliphilus peptidifermentans DSM 18978]|uniref:Undecaprenyl diphosphate synthase n=1 Tax=Alkaliphilus peptidifermentans DSM 18978 TaxID=1120976 RepID=A0A1G5K9K0_9FIRM|nr:undecaprenyl diphosphate synthase family protein [Alkaliphilus peptidifermentans]SCY97114.1 undecaprenyl diphosphate synthase [Alkaliphilus peptidifermentans DSM 18978]